MARKSYSPEVKAAAMSALMAGQGVDQVASQYDVPASTLRGWKSKLRNEGHVPTQKKEAVGELLIRYIETNLKTLVAQSKVFGDPEWIRQQDAQEMAVLHGVITDKTVRILEAMGAPNRGGDAPREIEG